MYFYLSLKAVRMLALYIKDGVLRAALKALLNITLM